MKKNIDFLGKGWGFPPQFEKGQDGIHVRMVTNEEDIEESLGIILSTQLGERIMHQDFGADMQSFLYKPMSVSVQTKMKQIIFDAIYEYEPRVIPDKLVVTNQTLEGKIILDISYIVKATNARHNIVFPYYLGEGTLL
jgi:Phage baseplate assembly protein W